MSNGPTNGNGNNNISNRRAIATEALGLGVAEFASSIASLGVVAVADDLAPNLMKSATKAVARVCVEPFLDTWEKVLKTFCKLEECQSDPTKSRQERAEKLAHTLTMFSAAWVGHMLVKIATRKGMNVLLGTEHKPPEKTGKPVKDFWNRYIWPDRADRKIFFWDEGTHLGSLLLLNTGMAKHTDEMIKGTSGILQKTLGWSKKRSDDVASMGIIWELPNIIGWTAGVGAIAHDILTGKRTPHK